MSAREFTTCTYLLALQRPLREGYHGLTRLYSEV